MRSYYLRIRIYAIEKCSPNLLYAIFSSTSLAYMQILMKKNLISYLKSLIYKENQKF